MDVELIEPISKYSKVFKTPDEFNVWYSKNKNDVDKLTTHKLNKLYKIDNYRITKIQGKLMLKKWDNDRHIKVSRYDEKINNLKHEISEIRESVNKIITYLHDSNDTLNSPNSSD